MTELIYKTKGNSEPGRKPRVYFSCHPDDFAYTFEAVCGDIHNTHDCIIFYKKDMADDLPEETRETDLGRMNLFVFPVTFRLLREEDSAVVRDLEFAVKEHKPILPVVFEHSMDSIMRELYSKKFGERQYLSRFSTDDTKISYNIKLRKVLESILISDETAERIRKAFDAYIFLSYRKMDRKYANELMRLMHSDPLCRDIAIWFDEFLTPGENFETSIDNALKKSRMVALLVTPSLLKNNKDDSANYVQAVEYPNAREMGKPILPAEKVSTDRTALAENFEGLPEVIDANDEILFHDEFLKAVSDIAKHEKTDDPMHNYLIGLAYLDGIDVEINSEYGMELVTKAANAELPEAMEKLSQIYLDIRYGNMDFCKSSYWGKKYYNYQLEHRGKDHPDTLNALKKLADILILDAFYSMGIETNGDIDE